MQILITGINGFVGSCLAGFLLKKGMSVNGIVHNKNSLDRINHIKDNITLFFGDIRDNDFLVETLKEVNPEVIFHLAGITNVPASIKDPGLTFEVNLQGTLNLLESVLQTGGNPKILFASSSEVYGKVKSEMMPINENIFPMPANPYSISKYSCEMMLSYYLLKKKLDIIIMRPFNHIGSGQSSDFVVSSFARQIVEIEAGNKEDTIKVGNLQALRDFTDVRDIVSGYWEAMQKCKSGTTYNICSERPVKISDLLNKLIELSTAPNIKITKDVSRMRESDIPMFVGDCASFKKVTGWRTEISLEDSLDSILNYWRSKIMGTVR